jgi:signal transduction histidine kinase
MGTAGEKGTGLGLVVCKEFTDTHGGRIEVESSPTAGSSFHVYLPDKETEEPAVQQL